MAKRTLGPATLTMVQAIRSAGSPDQPWLVACSGGRDSLALAAAAALARPGAVSAVVIDHQLQAGSSRVAEQVRDQLAPRGVPVAVVPVAVGTTGGPEAAARTARYRALVARAREQGAELLLGHTRDDQAETVLLGLARGSGTRALAGMPPHLVRDGVRLVRPLIELPRETSAAVCGELGLEWWDDPHNRDARFVRSRVRTAVMPVLEGELGPGVAEALARTARLLREDADHLDALAAQARERLCPCVVDGDEAGASLGLPVEDLAALPSAIRGRVLRDWLRDRGGTDLGEVHITAVDRLVTAWHGQGPIAVPGVGVERRGGHLYVVPPR